jgi:hypothetical protein
MEEIFAQVQSSLSSEQVENSFESAQAHPYFDVPPSGQNSP